MSIDVLHFDCKDTTINPKIKIYKFKSETEKRKINHRAYEQTNQPTENCQIILFIQLHIAFHVS